MILYEYPCNERVRSLLRVEHLFGRLFFFAGQEDVNHHQIAMATLFDLLEVCDRTDLRGAVLQDLDRQRAALVALREHPGVDGTAVEKMLADLEKSSGELSNAGRVAQALRDNEWLATLKGRLAVPGGSSPADIPSYYAWQIKPASVRQKDLQHWISAFRPLYNGLSLILRLLRESGHASGVEAEQGAYQEMLSGKSFQLLRVWVDPALGVFPEMSANKYVIWVRFLMQDYELKPIAVTRRVPFRLSRCNF